MVDSFTRTHTLRRRVRAQQLDRGPGTTAAAEAAVLDLGAQDTGTDGALWALTVRGVDTTALDVDDLALAWTLRGAPHTYRRAELPSVAAALGPWSEADAAKRIFDAAKPLREAGISALDGLDTVAAHMRALVTAPMVKGELSTRLTELLPPALVRDCRPCRARHCYEMPFRLAPLRAGLELEPASSPPVLRPIPAFSAADHGEPRHDPIRGYLHLLGPATPKHVAEFVDSPVSEVKARWPQDAAEVHCSGERRWMLQDDLARMDDSPTGTTRLLGPHDLFLQARDRPLLVADRSRAKALWPTLGRPGAVLAEDEIAGLWRPRTSGRKLTVTVHLWDADTPALRHAIGEQAERLAAFRGRHLAAVDFDT